MREPHVKVGDQVRICRALAYRFPGDAKPREMSIDHGPVIVTKVCPPAMIPQTPGALIYPLEFKPDGLVENLIVNDTDVIPYEKE